MIHYRSFSQLILCGRLGQDAQLRQSQSGLQYLSFGLGTSESFKDQSGKYTQKTTWHDCVMFGSRAEKIASALTKGTLVLVQATLGYREVTLDNGHKAKAPSIRVEDIQILGESRKDGETTGQAAPAPARSQPQRRAPARQAAAAPQSASTDPFAPTDDEPIF